MTEYPIKYKSRFSCSIQKLKVCFNISKSNWSINKRNKTTNIVWRNKRLETCLSHKNHKCRLRSDNYSLKNAWKLANNLSRSSSTNSNLVLAFRTIPMRRKRTNSQLSRSRSGNSKLLLWVLMVLVRHIGLSNTNSMNNKNNKNKMQVLNKWRSNHKISLPVEVEAEWHRLSGPVSFTLKNKICRFQKVHSLKVESYLK